MSGSLVFIWILSSVSSFCSELMHGCSSMESRTLAEAAQLAQSHVGTQGLSSPGEDERPSQDV